MRIFDLLLCANIIYIFAHRLILHTSSPKWMKFSSEFRLLFVLLLVSADSIRSGYSFNFIEHFRKMQIHSHLVNTHTHNMHSCWHKYFPWLRCMQKEWISLKFHLLSLVLNFSSKIVFNPPTLCACLCNVHCLRQQIQKCIQDTFMYFIIDSTRKKEMERKIFFDSYF